jgi:hypothetical protein
MASETQSGLVAVSPVLISGLLAAGRLKPVPSSLLSLMRKDLGGEIPPDPLPPQIEVALEILAQPEARIVVRASERHETTGYGTLFRRGPAVVQAALTPDGLVVAPPQSVRGFIARVLGEIGDNTPPDAATPSIILSPIALAGASWLWSLGPSEAADPARSADLIASLTSGGVKQPADLLKGVIQSGLVCENGNTVMVEPAYRPWLERVWTDQFFEIGVMPLIAEREPTAEEVRVYQQQLALVGVKGARVACRAILGSELAVLGKGALPKEAEEDWFVLLSYLTNDKLRSLLEALLPTVEQLQPTAAVATRV